DVVFTVLPTYWKVSGALERRPLIAVMQTTMIRASITAYSTAVGPSSAFRNFTTPRFRFDSMTQPSFRIVLTKGPPRKKRTVTTDKRGSCNPSVDVAPGRLLG